ncbi:MAG TPA: PIG-L deacetylase family protein [Gemmatimonadaceae bacterium]|nr:PIG-L deacetylase family protein [Gemmatimonadaceae bacterium]
MTDSDLTRRDFVSRSIAAGSTALAAGTLPIPALHGGPAAATLSVVCVGAHPDDPESGCAGTLARYAAAGHAVTIVYLTRGERGIDGKGLDESARIRTAESEAACRIIGATPVFFGQVDGATEVTRAHIDAMTTLVRARKPDVLLTHWPVDTHPDHQVASMLATRAWMALRTPRLYYFEVNAGSQTEGFHPNAYVDITSVVDQKKKALFAHVSQDGTGIWHEHHEPMASWRGRETGVAWAEGFYHVSRGAGGDDLPQI